jgi:uncharacterized protein (DUF2235 family)
VERNQVRVGLVNRAQVEWSSRFVCQPTADRCRARGSFAARFARPFSAHDESQRFGVRFLGVWDTVSSVGWILGPREVLYTARNTSSVIHHAVSIDEGRWFFRQKLLQPEGHQDFKELWFQGVHSDMRGDCAESDGGLADAV